MKERMLKLVKNEGGQALLLAIALLGLGGIMLAPMLSLMGTGLKTGGVYESKERQIYAADAGIEDAIWQIKTNGEYLVDVITDPENPKYGLPTDDEDDSQVRFYDIAPVNGENVRIMIRYLDDVSYKVISKATAADGSSDTEIEAYVTSVYGNYCGITENVITCPNGYDIDGPPDYHPAEGEDGYEEHGPEGNYDGPWPMPEELMNYYSMFVDKDNPYDYEEIDLSDEETFDEDYIEVFDDEIQIGAAYIEGNFDIINTSNTVKTLKLNGNLYITGKTNFGGQKEWILDLNGHSIFVESDLVSGAGPAFLLGGKVTVTGSGCIIAIGDINFEPHMDATPDDYILILSVIGQTWMHPVGNFYGTLAGYSEVYVQNGSIYWSNPDYIEPPDGIPDIDFPGGSSATVVYGVNYWKIS